MNEINRVSRSEKQDTSSVECTVNSSIIFDETKKLSSDPPKRFFWSVVVDFFNKILSYFCCLRAQDTQNEKIGSQKINGEFSFKEANVTFKMKDLDKINRDTRLKCDILANEIGKAKRIFEDKIIKKMIKISELKPSEKKLEEKNKLKSDILENYKKMIDLDNKFLEQWGNFSIEFFFKIDELIPLNGALTNQSYETMRAELARQNWLDSAFWAKPGAFLDEKSFYFSWDFLSPRFFINLKGFSKNINHISSEASEEVRKFLLEASPIKIVIDRSCRFEVSPQGNEKTKEGVGTTENYLEILPFGKYCSLQIQDPKFYSDQFAHRVRNFVADTTRKILKSVQEDALIVEDARKEFLALSALSSKERLAEQYSPNFFKEIAKESLAWWKNFSGEKNKTHQKFVFPRGIIAYSGKDKDIIKNKFDQSCPDIFGLIHDNETCRIRVDSEEAPDLVSDKEKFPVTMYATTKKRIRLVNSIDHTEIIINIRQLFVEVHGESCNSEIYWAEIENYPPENEPNHQSLPIGAIQNALNKYAADELFGANQESSIRVFSRNEDIKTRILLKVFSEISLYEKSNRNDIFDLSKIITEEIKKIFQDAPKIFEKKKINYSFIEKILSIITDNISHDFIKKIIDKSGNRDGYDHEGADEALSSAADVKKNDEEACFSNCTNSSRDLNENSVLRKSSLEQPLAPRSYETDNKTQE